jgi:hypothetical protein
VVASGSKNAQQHLALFYAMGEEQCGDIDYQEYLVDYR